MADLFEASVRIKAVLDKTQLTTEAKAAADHLNASPPTVPIKPKINPADTTKEVEQGIVGPLKASTGTIASTIGLLGLGAVLKGGFDELKEQQGVIVQTNALLKATGGAAGVTADEIAKLAEAEQDKTGKDKEAIQAGENQLLQFKNVRNQVGENNDIFTQASKLALDLSQATGQDLSAAYVTLGRALEDPVQGARALKAAHVVLTASDRELIKSLEDQGKTLEAQQFILGKVKGQVEGLAEAYGETAAGKIERAKNTLDDAKAAIVNGFAPAINFAADAATKFGQAVEHVPGPVLAISASLLGIGLAVGPVTNAFRGLSSVFGLMADGVRLAVSQTAAMSGSLGGLASATGPAAAGLVAVTAYTIAYKKAMEEATTQAGELTKKALDKGLSGSREDALKQIQEIQRQAASIDQDINNLHFYDATKSNDLTIWKNGLAQANNELVVLVNQSDDLAKATGDSTDKTFNWLEAQKKLGVTYASTDEALQAYTGNLDDNSDANDSSADSAKKAADEAKKQADAFKEATDALDKMVAAQDDLIGSNLSYGDAQRAVNSAERDLAQVQRDHAQAVRDAQKAQDDYNAVLRDPKADPRARADALAHLQDAQRRASPEQLAEDEADARSKLEKAIDNQAKAYQKLLDDQRAATGGTNDAKTSAGEYADELKRLEDRFPTLRAELQGFTGDLDAAKARSPLNIEIDVQAKNKAIISNLTDLLNSRRTGPSSEPLGGSLPIPGRAAGGPVQGGIYSINEDNIPETLTINGRQYLLVPPGQSGQVNALSAQTPNGIEGSANGTLQDFYQTRSNGVVERVMGFDDGSYLVFVGDQLDRASSAIYGQALDRARGDLPGFSQAGASSGGGGGGGRPASLSGGYGTTSNQQAWLQPTFNINHPHPAAVAREVTYSLMQGFNPRQAA